MHKWFVNGSTEELSVELSDGRRMPLEDLVREYEKVSLEKVATSEPKDDGQSVSRLRVGEWFRIDRNVIDGNKDKIYCQCIEEGRRGKKLWKRFVKSNRIAKKNPYKYSRIIEVYIFDEKTLKGKNVQEIRNMCEREAEGMCDEVICNLELQMRICNGELVADLLKKADELPCIRTIEPRNGGTGFVGGGATHNDFYTPAFLKRYHFLTDSYKVFHYTPYVFRRVLSEH